MAVRISIGRYYSADSPIHRLDPRLKLIAAIIYMASCLFVSNVPTLLLAGALIVLAMALARVPIGRVLSQIKPAMYFLVITSLFNLFLFTPALCLQPLGRFRLPPEELARRFSIRCGFVAAAHGVAVHAHHATDGHHRRRRAPFLSTRAARRTGEPGNAYPLDCTAFCTGAQPGCSEYRRCSNGPRGTARRQRGAQLRTGLRAPLGAPLCKRRASRRQPRSRYGRPLLYRRAGAHALPRHALYPSRRHRGRGARTLPCRTCRSKPLRLSTTEGVGWTPPPFNRTASNGPPFARFRRHMRQKRSSRLESVPLYRPLVKTPTFLKRNCRSRMFKSSVFSSIHPKGTDSSVELFKTKICGRAAAPFPATCPRFASMAPSVQAATRQWPHRRERTASRFAARTGRHKLSPPRERRYAPSAATKSCVEQSSEP